MSIDPNNPIVGRIDAATQSAAHAQQAQRLREEQRQRIEPSQGSSKPSVSDHHGRRSPRGPEAAGPTSSDVLKHVADYARRLPPPEDLLAVQASANTFALINLDAAKAIAREVRDSIERDDGPDGVARLQEALFSDQSDRGDVADALAG